MSKIIVNNWKEVWKSYAVWFPVIALIVHNTLEMYIGNYSVPEEYLPVLVYLSSGLGWIIKQNSIKKGVTHAENNI